MWRPLKNSSLLLTVIVRVPVSFATTCRCLSTTGSQPPTAVTAAPNTKKGQPSSNSNNRGTKHVNQDTKATLEPTTTTTPSTDGFLTMSRSLSLPELILAANKDRKVLSSTDRLQRFQVLVNSLINQFTSRGIHAQQLIDVLKFAPRSGSQQIWHEHLYPHILQPIIQHARQQTSPNQLHPRLLSPLTNAHLNELFGLCAQQLDRTLALEIYLYLIRPTLHLPAPIVEFPTFSTDLPPHSNERQMQQYIIQARARFVPSTSQLPYSSTADARVPPPPTQLTLTTLVSAIRTFLEVHAESHALVVYQDLWTLIDHYQLHRTSQPIFSTLPITALFQLFRDRHMAFHTVHLYSTCKLEYVYAIREWTLKLKERDSQDASPVIAPKFLPSESSNESFWLAIFQALFRCTMENKRRNMEYYVQLSLEQTRELMADIIASSKESTTPQIPIQQLTGITPSAETDVIEPTVDDQPEDKDVDQESKPIESPTTFAEESIAALLSRPSVSTIPPQSVDTYHAHLNQYHLTNPNSQQISKFHLLKLSLQYLITDYIRWHFKLHYQSAVNDQQRMTFLRPLILERVKPLGLRLRQCLEPTHFSLTLPTIYLPKSILQLMITDYLRFTNGAALAQPWFRILYNRSRARSAEPFDTSQWHQTQLEKEKAAVGERAWSKVQAIPSTLEMDDRTWKLGFMTYLRFAATYSHSIAIMKEQTVSSAQEQIQSPYALLKYLLQSKFAHAYLRSSTAYTQLKLKPPSHTAPIGTELSWFVWEEFWSFLELIRAELAQEQVSLRIRSLMPTMQEATALYTKLEQEFICGACEEGLKRRYIQIIQQPNQTHFLIHIPSILFPDPINLRHQIRTDLISYIRMGMRSLQYLITSGRIGSANNLTVAFVPIFRTPPLAAPNRSHLNPNEALYDLICPSSPLNEQLWCDRIENEIQFVIQELFRWRLQPNIKLDPTVLSQLQPCLGSMRDGRPLLSLARPMLSVDSAKLLQWQSRGFLSFYSIDDYQFLPPNTSAAQSFVWKQSNAAELDTKTIPSTSVVSSSTRGAVAPQKPVYSTGMYYLSHGSSFLLNRQHRHPIFDGGLDLQMQGKEWREILELLKSGGEVLTNPA